MPEQIEYQEKPSPSQTLENKKQVIREIYKQFSNVRKQMSEIGDRPDRSLSPMASE
jgi:hypothetical protein